MAAIGRFDWSIAFSAELWTPLSELFPGATAHAEGLYMHSEDAYILVSPVDHRFKRGLPNAPFVTAICWARGKDAARRCFLRDSSVEPEKSIVAPPRKLLQRTDGTYGGLVQSPAAKETGSCSERASYDNAGLFLHKSIDAGDVHYYFRERRVIDGEMPYAIQVRLRKQS